MRLVWFGWLALCGGMVLAGHAGAAPIEAGSIRAVGAESQYADVISQIGGRYVQVSAIMDNPNLDPHAFEVSPVVARRIARARLIVENGLGYDGWAAKMIAATPNRRRIVINVGALVDQRGKSPLNPHLWYDPRTMPRVAQAIGAALTRLDPAHAAYFAARVQVFDRSLRPWQEAIAAFKAKYHGVTVAVTEPVADDLLTAMGAHIATPWGLQAAIMNGTDPAPQDVATEDNVLRTHKVKIFVYNRQVTDPLTTSFLRQAARYHVPVVGVYEIMPHPGFDYQSWMLAETRAFTRAVAAGQSTRRLVGKRAP